MKRVVLVLLVILVLFTSGCLEDNICKDIEREAAKNNITCHCTPTNIMPSDYENISAKPKCACLCYSNGVWVNTTIAIADDITKVSGNP